MNDRCSLSPPSVTGPPPEGPFLLLDPVCARDEHDGVLPAVGDLRPRLDDEVELLVTRAGITTQSMSRKNNRQIRYGSEATAIHFVFVRPSVTGIESKL